MKGTQERMLNPTYTNTSPLWVRASAWLQATWQRVLLGGILLVSAFLNLWQLGQNGYGNVYYAAAVRSMGDNWKAFFFVSLDPAGFVTVDKPPIGFWLQVISTKIFGFSPFAIFLPQALAGIAAVALLYWLVRRHFGEVAGLLAALALALSPISVVTNRNNTIDSTLTLAMLIGAWTVMRAAESGQLRWLLLTAVSVGVGFNIKMLEAYLVVPAFALLYLLAAPHSWRKRIIHLLLAGALMAAVSLSWAVIVDAVPASSRPYVGSSQNNSEVSLAFGYNGITRLLGMGFGRGAAPATAARPPATGGTGPSGGTGAFGGTGPSGGTASQFPYARGGVRGFRDFAGGRAGGNAPGLFNAGQTGFLRLFTQPLGGQTGWILVFALAGMVALAWQRRFQPQQDRQQQGLILWGTWLVTMVVFFSVAGFIHDYYLTVMAPAIAAFFGIGLVVLWRDYLAGGWRGLLLPVAIALTAIVQIFLIESDPAWGTWMIPLIATGAVGGIAVLALARYQPTLQLGQRAQLAALGLAVAAILLVPAVWSISPAIHDQTANLPAAGPGGAELVNGANTVETGLMTYLLAHRGSATYVVAAASANQVDNIILATNAPAMAMGGFLGTDPILTTTALAQLVHQGAVRYFLINGGRAGAGPGGGSQTTVTLWVIQHCTVVPASAYQTTAAAPTSGFGRFGQQQLYDCQGAQG